MSVRKKIVITVLGYLMKKLTRIEYVDAENIPLEGGVIIATNHMSRLDVPLLLLNPTRNDLKALVTDKYKNHPIIGFLVNSMESIWLDRTKADFSAFRTAIEFLKQGGCLGIAPEGTRSTTGALIEGKPGAILLATKTQVPIVPVGIEGTENAVSLLTHFRRPHLIARFGKVFTLPPLERENRDELLREFTDEVMCRIAVQLPERYWGVYAQHPRLKELLNKAQRTS
jgi:1-acyl-sn-glycerol-3-phosphate acyltransferase